MCIYNICIIIVKSLSKKIFLSGWSTHPSITDDSSLAFMQLQDVTTISCLGQEEVHFSRLIRFFEKGYIHALERKT